MHILPIPTAYAAQQGAGQANAGFNSILMLVLLFAVFYLLLVRPQTKRAKAHRELVAKLAVGDEVITSGGLAGKVEKVEDDFLVLTISENVKVSIQRHAITTMLPKGTLKA